MSSVNQLGLSGIVSLATSGQAPQPSQDPAKIRDAAQQFEALLIGQILHSAHSKDSGWLGESDSSSDCATDYAEEQLAATMAQRGGFGLASLITAGLTRKP